MHTTVGGALVLALTLAPCAGCTATEGALHYRLNVRIEPVAHRLEAEARIQHPPSPRFYLHPRLTVRRVRADGQEVGWHGDTEAGPMQYSVGVPVLVESAGMKELHVEYGGEIDEVANDVNMVTADLVELASYAAWYPCFEGMPDFTFDLESDLPAGYATTTNGELRSMREHGERRKHRWESYAPGSDVVILSSPDLDRLAAEGEGGRVEVYYSGLPAQYMDERLRAMTRAMGRLAEFYGPPHVRGVLRFVYSPRGGWGYSRAPLFVVSADRVRRRMREEDSDAWDLHENCHEMAHFWWALADTATPDDWINEGLAEFSAFRISREQSGEAFAEALVREYEQQDAEGRTPTPIVETTSSSPDRYLNYYVRPTLMFIEAQRRFGAEPLDRVLRALHGRFAGTRALTTSLFLEEVEVQMGREAAAFFRETLSRENAVGQPGAQR